MSFIVTLLTGAPASGKTTASQYISQQFESFKILRYGEVLFEHKKKEYPNLSYKEFREQSALINSVEDLEKADALIIELAKKYSSEQNVLIESHGVTVEDYGFRVTPYKSERVVRALNLNSIIYIYSNPESIIRRVAEKGDGRKSGDLNKVKHSLRLQEGLALSYSILSGATLYCVENNQSIQILQKRVQSIIEKTLNL